MRDQFGYAPDVTFVLNCHATESEALRDGLKTAAKESGHIGIGISDIRSGRLMVQTVAT